jgi:hypothetical protein
MIKVRKAALFADHAPMTAAVFHLMRTAEIGVRAVARCLGIPDPLKPAGRNWGSILVAVKAEMARRNGVNPPAWSLPDDRQFFDEAHTSLDAVRNAWRNTTMHVDLSRQKISMLPCAGL